MLGKLIPDFFPKIFGPEQNQPLDADAVRTAFADARATRSAARRRRRSPTASSRSRSRTWPTRSRRSRCSAATTSPATRSTASAAPAASTPAWSPTALGMTKVLIHPFSSLLSAYGMGLADIRATRQQAIEEPFGASGARSDRAQRRASSATTPSAEVAGQGVAADEIKVHRARPHPLRRHRHRAGRAGIHGRTTPAAKTAHHLPP